MNTNYPQTGRKRFNSFYFEKPSNYIPLDKDLNKGIPIIKTKKDDYYKYLKSLEAPKNMLKNNSKMPKLGSPQNILNSEQMIPNDQNFAPNSPPRSGNKCKIYQQTNAKSTCTVLQTKKTNKKKNTKNFCWTIPFWLVKEIR